MVKTGWKHRFILNLLRTPGLDNRIFLVPLDAEILIGTKNGMRPLQGI